MVSRTTRGLVKRFRPVLSGLLAPRPARTRRSTSAAVNRRQARSADSLSARPICCSAFRPWSASLALPTAWPTTPSADFCPRSEGLSAVSVAAMATRGRSPGVSSIAFGAQPPDLRFAPLMDMDFATRCPLVRRLRLVSGFCPSARTFASRFLQTPPRGDSPCASLTLHLHQVG